MSQSVRYTCFILIAVFFGALSPAAGSTSGYEAASADVNDTTMSDDLMYYTEQLPPYNYMENGTLQGLSVDLLEEITEKMGKKVTREDIKLVPWTEGYQAALTQNNTVLFSTARTPEREQSFKWAGPIYSDRYVLFALPDRGITIESPEDLKEYRIGVIADDATTQRLLDIGVNRSQIVSHNNVSANIAGLENGDIDLWACPEDAGRYFAEQATGNYYSYTVVYKLETQDLYYAFSKDVPDSVVESFQQVLDTVKQEKDASGISTYDRILGQYIPSIGLAQLNYLTEEWAPFNYKEDGNATGISVELLESIFKNVGVNRSRADVRIVPLAEGFQTAQNNTSTVLFSIVLTPEREPLYKWAGPFTKASFVLYAPISSNITISSAEDLNQYRIGAVNASIENDLLTSQGVNASQIVNGQTPEDLLQMLDNGQIDLWATGDLAGRHQMLKTSEDPNAYEIVYTLSENDFYYIFSKDVPDTLVSAFEQAIETARNQKDEQGISDYERIIYRNLGVGCIRQTFTDDRVVDLVNTTATAIEMNASDTFRRINAGEAPYRNPEDPGLYAFVYDTNMTVVAHADNIQLVGMNLKGKTDVTGKPFHEEILEGALNNGTGWVDYVYMHPVQTNLYYKTTYYRLTRGSDGNYYIVCSGNYKDCQNESEATPANNSTASPEELVAFVEKAFEYAHVNGQEAALREFNNQTGQFVDEELYIFAYDINGTTLALPFQPEIIGTNRWNATDANGTLFIQDLIATAQSGGGFVQYLYEDPADNFTVKQKLSYVMMVNQSWILGSGIYNPPENSSIVSVGTDPEIRDSLKSFVGEAIEYASINGKDAAIAEFNNKNGTFVLDDLYIYAFDYNGTTLALPYQPQLIGTDLSGLQDPYGVNYTKVEIFLAQQGGGFLFYHYYNPARNMTPEPKMSYVQKVDDTWWLGAGVYLPDVQQKMTVNDLAAFVQNASAYVAEVGDEIALAEFSKKDGQFSHGDVYTYAYDYNGTLLAHPYESDKVGTNRMNWTDIRGLPVIRIGEYTASNGGGFIAYLYPAPENGTIDEKAKDTYQPKIGYVYPAGENLWIGSGVYLADMACEGSSQCPGAVSDMIGLVEQCAAYGREKGSDMAFAEISNRSGMFVDAEGHYIYAYDYNGTLLAHPYLQEKIGSNLIDKRDQFGMETIRALAETAHSGGGYVVFIWPNPNAENREELKIGYVLPVDDTWWVGSGVYLSEITGTNESISSSVPG